jgi:hypothetical protein
MSLFEKLMKRMAEYYAKESGRISPAPLTVWYELPLVA